MKRRLTPTKSYHFLSSWSESPQETWSQSSHQMSSEKFVLILFTSWCELHWLLFGCRAPIFLCSVLLHRHIQTFCASDRTVSKGMWAPFEQCLPWTRAQTDYKGTQYLQQHTRWYFDVKLKKKTTPPKAPNSGWIQEVFWGTRPKTWNSSNRISENICKKCHRPLCIRLFCSVSLALLQR